MKRVKRTPTSSDEEAQRKEAEWELFKAELERNPEVLARLVSFTIETGQARAEARELLKRFTETEGIQGWNEYIAQNPPSGRAIAQLILMYVEREKNKSASKAANARLDQAGGYREKKRQIRDKWASGKYETREDCAKQEHETLGVSFSTARKYLRGAPKS